MPQSRPSYCSLAPRKGGEGRGEGVRPRHNLRLPCPHPPRGFAAGPLPLPLSSAGERQERRRGLLTRPPDADREDDDRAILTIDLGAVVDNWLLLQRAAAPAEAAAAVKADGYGLGMARVAPALAAAGARTFFVATAREGAALRALLPAPDIYVLN